MPLSRRYTPEWSPGDKATIGMDFSFVLPPGVGINEAALTVLRNTNPPIPSNGDWSQAPVQILGRAVYSVLTGGVAGIDYQLRWQITDSQGNVWTRTALMLCAYTS